MSHIMNIAGNKKAYHDYFVEDKYEVGIELNGTEVKSLRNRAVNLKDSYCKVHEGEMTVHGMHISPYEKGNIFNRDAYRIRKLLLHKQEIRKIHALVGQQGYSVIPLSLYFSGKWVKMELGLCKGKKLYDKRETEALKSAKRDAERTVRSKDY